MSILNLQQLLSQLYYQLIQRKLVLSNNYQINYILVYLINRIKYIRILKQIQLKQLIRMNLLDSIHCKRQDNLALYVVYPLAIYYIIKVRRGPQNKIINFILKFLKFKNLPDRSGPAGPEYMQLILPGEDPSVPSGSSRGGPLGPLGVCPPKGGLTPPHKWGGV